jgi:large subunit ribosomal protein L24
VNIRKKHQRDVQARGRTLKPGIIEFEAPMDISNVMFVCPKCDKPVRLGIKRDEGDIKRVCKGCGAELE